MTIQEGDRDTESLLDLFNISVDAVDSILQFFNSILNLVNILVNVAEHFRLQIISLYNEAADEQRESTNLEISQRMLHFLLKSPKFLLIRTDTEYSCKYPTRAYMPLHLYDLWWDPESPLVFSLESIYISSYILHK